MPGFRPQQILCLVDLSPASRLVLCWARLFAQAFASDAEILVEVLHASEPPRFVFEGQERVQLELTRTELHAAVDGLGREVFADRVPYQIVVEEGHPVQVVMRRLEQCLPDLIVMGSHGHDGMARVLLGSVAENVVRVGRCPMLIVKGAEPEKGGLKTVLCPVDFMESSVELLQAAAVLAAVMRARLEIVTAVDGPGSAGKAQERLHAWVPEDLRSMCPISERVMSGDAAERIVECLRDGHGELVVLGAEHRPFLEFTTLGRTTERVMRFSPSPVLLIPRPLPAGSMHRGRQ